MSGNYCSQASYRRNATIAVQENEMNVDGSETRERNRGYLRPIMGTKNKGPGMNMKLSDRQPPRGSYLQETKDKAIGNNARRTKVRG
jgi:hypothetical protein